MLSNSKNHLLSSLKIGWISIIIFGLAYYVFKNGEKIATTIATIPPDYIFWALLCILLGKLSAAYIMHISLVLQGQNKDLYAKHIWIYTASDMAKYVPGGVWAIIGRIAYYRKLDMSVPSISRALFVENLFFFFTALLIAIPIGFVLLPPAYLILLFSLMAFAFLVVLLFFFRAEELTRRLTFFWFGKFKFKFVISAVFVMSFGWIAMGTSFFLLLPKEMQEGNWLWAISSYAVSFIAGMAAVFAPAGAGVREGVLVLAGQVNGFHATSVLDAAILNRALWVAADAVFFGVSSLLKVLR